MKKKALLSSILTIALCLSLIAGSTFALFTSESKVNVAVTAGKVDVVATIEDLELYSPKAIGETGTITDATNAANETFVNGGTATLDGNKLTLTNITPGDKVTFNVKITNNSNVTIKYRSIVEKIADKGLWTGLKVTIGGTEYKGETKKSDWTVLNVGSDVITVPVVIELPTTAGSTYQEKSCELAYTVEAVQGNAEMPDEWNGESTEEIEQSPEDKLYHIVNAAQLVWLMENTQNVNSAYLNKTIVLDCDIDLGGATVKGIGSDQCNFAGSFDGRGHTISNFVIDTADRTYYGGLFNYVTYGTISNLNVSGATVIGQKQVGVLVGAVDGNATVTNCNVYDSTVIATKKVGAVAGYTLNSTVTDCYAENCNVYCAENDENECGEVIGYVNNNCTIDNKTAKDVTVKTGVTTVSTATQLATALTNAGNAGTGIAASKTILLTADIDGSSWTAVNGGTNYWNLTLDGNGHTISNLAQPLFTCLSAQDYVFENINFTNVNISSAGNNGLGVLVGEGKANGGGSYTITNCHINGGTIDGGSTYYVGGFIGFKSNGCNVTFEDCSVTDLTLKTSEESVGAFAGHLYDTVTLTNCSVKGNTTVINSADRKGSGAKAGAFVGTFYYANVTNCTVDSSVTVSNNNAADTVANGMFGRNAGGTLTIDGTVQ